MQRSDNHLTADRGAVSAGAPVHSDRPLVDLGRFVRILWFRRLVIAVCIAVPIIAAFAYIKVTPSTFTARAVMLVDPREVRFTDADEVLSGIGPDSAAIASQVAVLSSRELLTTVLQQENIFQDPEFTANGVVDQNAIYDNFLKRLSVERQGLTYVIEIAFTSRDREKSARIANAIVAQYIQGQISEKSRANADVTGILEGQIDGLRKSVSEAEAAAETFMANNDMLDMGAGRTLLLSQIEQLNVQVLASRDRARRVQNRYNQAKSVEPVANALIENGDILSSATADLLRNEHNQRSIELSRLAKIYGERHPLFVAQVSQLERLKALMEAETSRIVRGLYSELQLANEDVARAEKDLSILRSQSEATGQSEIELRQLQMQANSSREVLQQFMRRSKETGQLDNLQRSEARVISKAVPPTRATWPRPKLVLAVAGFLGAVFGLTLALLMGIPPAVPKTSPPDGVGPWPERMRKKFDRIPRTYTEKEITALGRLSSKLAVPRTTTGTYDRKALAAAKLELSESPDSSFSIQLWSMVDKLVDKLLDGIARPNSPHLVIFSGVAENVEACRLSYNTAKGLEQLGASVLMLDLNPLTHHLLGQPKADLVLALSDDKPLDPEFLFSQAARLPVVSIDDSGSRETGGFELDARAVDRLLAKTDGKFDFIVVNAVPWQDRDRMDALVKMSAQLVFVLTQEDDNAQKIATLSSEVGLGKSASYAVVEAIAPRQARMNPQSVTSNVSKIATRMEGAEVAVRSRHGG